MPTVSETVSSCVFAWSASSDELSEICFISDEIPELFSFRFSATLLNEIIFCFETATILFMDSVKAFMLRRILLISFFPFSAESLSVRFPAAIFSRMRAVSSIGLENFLEKKRLTKIAATSTTAIVSKI